MIVVLFVVVAAANVRADDTASTVTPQARLGPPVGVTTDARLGPPVGIAPPDETDPARVAPPTSSATVRVTPPSTSWFDVMVLWFQSRLSIPNR